MDDFEKIDLHIHTRFSDGVCGVCFWGDSTPIMKQSEYVEAAGDHDVAVELSDAWKIPNEKFVAECLRQGVKLSLGSDAHRPHIGKTSYGVKILKRLETSKDHVFLPRNLKA